MSVAQIGERQSKLGYRKEERSNVLHKSDTEDLFQETSPNPIKWAFLDEFSSDSCMS